MLKWVLISAILDRATKELVAATLAPGESIPLLGDLLRLTYITNTGAAFGLLADHTWVLAAVSLLLVVFVTWWYRSIGGSGRYPIAGPAAGLLVGGALGNLIDRAFRGYVVDFVDLGFWPVFNVADIAVVFGCALAFLMILKNPEMTGGGAPDEAN